MTNPRAPSPFAPSVHPKLLRRLSLTTLFTGAALPAILVVTRNQRDMDANELLVVIAASAFSLALMGTLLLRFPRIGLTLLLLIAVVAVPQAWFVINYGWTIDANALSLIAETNTAEAMDLLGSISPPIYAILLAPVILTLLSWPRPSGSLKRSGREHTRIGLLSAVGLGAISGTAILAGAAASPSIPDATFPPAPQGHALALRAAYPAGLAVTLLDYYRERRSLSNVFERHKEFRFGASPTRSTRTRRIYLLVIGETARADHLALNGYFRNTTPNLSRRSDLISFTRMYSASTFTRLSVPVILSRKPSESIAATFEEPSIIRAFREVGFGTHWISLQAPVGYHESPVSIHAKEAETATFLNPVDYRSHGKHDDAALPVLRNLIDRDNRDLFIVIHTLGSHFRYSDRYPARFRKFLPDRRADRPLRLFSADDKEHLVNSYDNSLLFTDYVLDRIIQMLSDTPNIESWMFYISDHGEALFDDCRMFSGHGHSARSTHSVASIFWYSKTYAQQNPAALKALRRHSTTLTSTSMMFETLASLGGIDVPGTRTENDMTALSLRVPKEVEHVETEDARACLAQAYDALPQDLPLSAIQRITGGSEK